jgi:hypothetical protein
MSAMERSLRRVTADTGPVGLAYATAFIARCFAGDMLCPALRPVSRNAHNPDVAVEQNSPATNGTDSV